MDVNVEKIKREVESRHGPGIWQSMWDRMLELIQHKGKRWLWEFLNTNQVHCACVWAPGGQECLQQTPVTDNEFSEWWPVLVSCDPQWRMGDLYPVLCSPLLNGGCHKPWMTYGGRILMMPVAVRSLPVRASGPPVGGLPLGVGLLPGPQGLPSTNPGEATISHADSRSSSSSISTAGPPVGPPPGPPVGPPPVPPVSQPSTPTMTPGQQAPDDAESSTTGTSAGSWSVCEWDILD